ncbi:hypothetical protein MVEN_02589100 [Mycena venus]|uniref:Uncharacterized protein n=1 Tax=Mycena venus TaxID=2733690 RepID=A0A8H6U3L0_9AGAR|nr:hypothetical protein MVEN_02589100 [Mycena venus]
MPLVESNRLHLATAPPTALSQEALQELFDSNTHITPSLSDPTNLYEVMDVENISPSVAQPTITQDMLKRIADLEVAGTDHRTCRADLEAARAACEAARTDLNAARTDLDAARTDLNAARTDLNAARTDLDAARTDLNAARTDLNTARTDLNAARAELRSREAISVDWQVWSRAQDAVDELIFLATRDKCGEQGIRSAAELRNALNLRTAANNAAAHTIVNEAPSDLRDAATAIRIEKRALERSRHPLAHPVVTVADLRRLAGEEIAEPLLTRIAASRRGAEPRFVA